ncbi:MAG: epoxyqueuosine reductase QueH [Thermoplasmata archaeon]
MILVHACCAPCLSGMIDDIDQEFKVYFYNPNIHPLREYIRRLETLIEFSKDKKFELIIDKEYNVQEWLENAVKLNKKGDYLRCMFCYADRLDRVAKYAKENGYDGFTTSMLYSPFQKHEMIKQIGYRMEKKYGIKFYYKDYRENYPKGDEMARKYKMYRQGYCGCIFSEFDRYSYMLEKYDDRNI